MICFVYACATVDLLCIYIHGSVCVVMVTLIEILGNGVLLVCYITTLVAID